MTKDQEIALTASHLAAGLIGYSLFGAGKDSNTSYGDLLELWGQGCLELHTELSQYAPFILDVLESVGEDQGFPGVFHYEVTEEFGEWFAGMIVEHDGAPPAEERCREKIVLLTAAFFSRLPDAESKSAVLSNLASLGWATPAALHAALFGSDEPEAAPQSPWAVGAVEPKFKAGDEVYHLNGKYIRKAVVNTVTIYHRVWQAKEDAQPHHSCYVQYAVEGVGQARQDTVFATADEAFAAAK